MPAPLDPSDHFPLCLAASERKLRVVGRMGSPIRFGVQLGQIRDALPRDAGH